MSDCAFASAAILIVSDGVGGGALTGVRNLTFGVFFRTRTLMQPTSAAAAVAAAARDMTETAAAVCSFSMRVLAC